jgi:hypothetical protein
MSAEDGAILALILGLTYVTADFVLAILYGHCVLPGLRCRACKEKKS